MKLKLFAALLATAFASGSAYADGIVAGKVFSKEDSKPLDYVNITFINPANGTQLPIGTMTDAAGTFSLKVADGEYIVRISSVGTISQEREVTISGTDINLGNIELATDTKILEEVVVTGQKSQVSFDAERRVFNVSSNISSTGASAEELLASVPSVDVSSDGTISLRGNDDVLVWVNGKAMGMNADNRSQILRQIPAETIESIEVMINPSSKHSTEGTAGIINIRLKHDHRDGYFGNAEVGVDSRGSVNANANINYNLHQFEVFANLGLKSQYTPGGATSYRNYDDGTYLNSIDDRWSRENSAFLTLGLNYKPNENNLLYISAVGTLGHKWGHANTDHFSNLPDQWAENMTSMATDGDTQGANILFGYRHDFGTDHFIDLNGTYNIWQGPNTATIHEQGLWLDGTTADNWIGQHQDVKISNWEAAVDYSVKPLSWLNIEAGFKGNYNRENSPASYESGATPSQMTPMNNLYNRFIYDTDINALYLNLSGKVEKVDFAVGLRGESWQIRTRSLGYGQTEADVAQFKNNDFSLFPSASIGWTFLNNNELKLNYSRRIRRPFGPQLNTFENISDPSEVHLGNPTILPEFSNSVELTYMKNWGAHMLSVAGYMRRNNDMISHISFLAPMASTPDVETMYYGHANVGNLTNAGVEIISKNTLFDALTLTTTANLYNSHLKAWSTDYPLHGSDYTIYGAKQCRFVWDVRCMASVRLPWDMTFQATGRYSSRRIEPQGYLEPDWDVEAGLRKAFGAWNVSLFCKDIFDSKSSHTVLIGNGYTQDIKKWSAGRTLRLSVSYTFGKSHKHDNCHHNHIDTGGYGDDHDHGHSH